MEQRNGQVLGLKFNLKIDKNMVKIKRLLSDSYYVEVLNSNGISPVDVMNQIKEYLLEKEIGGFDKSNNKSALFHTNKVLKGVVNCCMLNGINFEVEFI